MSNLAQCCKGGANMAANHSIEVLLSSYASAMTIQDLQNALNIKARKARNLVLHGEIPAFKIAGQYRMFKTDVASYLMRCQVTVA